MNVACCGCEGGSPAPTCPCDATAARAPSPLPTPGCADKPSDSKSSSGCTCAHYVSKSYCIADGCYSGGWFDSSTFDDSAVNGVAATVARCGCGGGSTVNGKQVCQGHSFDKATCEAVRCCRWDVLLGCRANDKDAQCYSATVGTTGKSMTTAGPGPDTTASAQTKRGAERNQRHQLCPREAWSAWMVACAATPVAASAV